MSDDRFAIEFNKKLGGIFLRPDVPRVRKCSHRSFYGEPAVDWGLDPEVWEVTRCVSCNRVYKRNFRGGRRVQINKKR